MTTPLTIHGVPLLFTSGQNVAITPFTLTASGGTGPYTFSSIGAPTGVSVDIATGIVSGTPTESGNFDVQFETMDSVAGLATKVSVFAILSDLVINSAPTFEVPRQQFLVVGKQMTPVGLKVADDTGYADPITYSASWLPPGLTIDPATGLISGAPLVYVGAQTILLYAVDANGNKFQGVLELEIFPAINGADASQEGEQEGMLLFLQRPICLGATEEPATSVETLVLDAAAAMALAYPA